MPVGAADRQAEWSASVASVTIEQLVPESPRSVGLGANGRVGFTGTLVAITAGFGELGAKVGLLIGFGVVIGSLLHATGAFKRRVSTLVSAVGPR